MVGHRLDPKGSWLVPLPAPVFYAISFAAGFWLIPGHSRDWWHNIRLIGWPLLATGLPLGRGSAVHFASRRTTPNPAGQSSRLVTTGAFRFTRNPMYLALAIGYVGLALLLEKVSPLFLLPPLLLLNLVVIPFEEARLEATFGPEFSAYRRRVCRWI